MAYYVWSKTLYFYCSISTMSKLLFDLKYLYMNAAFSQNGSILCFPSFMIYDYIYTCIYY